MLGPDAPAIGSTALATEQQIAEGIFPTVFPQAGGGASPGPALTSFSPGQLQLNCIEQFVADNGLVVILDEDFVQLSRVWNHFLADAVLDKSFLKQGIPTVFLVGQNTLDIGNYPLRLASRSKTALSFQLLLDGAQGISSQVSLVDEADDLRLLRHDLRFPVRPPLIAQQLLVLHGDMALLHGLPLSPTDPAAGTLTLSLGEGSVEGDQELALWVDRIDILLLKNYWDSQTSQLPGIIEGVHGVSGEAGDGLGQDHIDLSLAALADHPQKFLPLIGGSPRDALICKHTGHGPVRFLHDFLRVVGELVLIAGDLLLTVGGHPAVGRDPQIPFSLLLLGRLRLGWDDDDLGRGIGHCFSPPSIV